MSHYSCYKLLKMESLSVKPGIRIPDLHARLRKDICCVPAAFCDGLQCVWPGRTSCQVCLKGSLNIPKGPSSMHVLRLHLAR